MKIADSNFDLRSTTFVIKKIKISRIFFKWKLLVDAQRVSYSAKKMAKFSIKNWKFFMFFI